MRQDEAYISKCEATAEGVIKYGPEADRILEFAAAEKADLIVLGARGMGFLESLLGGGSVADKVVRHSKIPVLVVPSH